MPTLKPKLHFPLGDTLIEVMMAIGIFSLVAIAVVSVVNGGNSDIQTTLESTMARNEIDAQAEALRFIQSAYIAERTDNSEQSQTEEGGPYKKLWKKITSYALSSEDPKATFPQTTTCDELYKDGSAFKSNGLILNTKLLNSNDPNSIVVTDKAILTTASLYPRLIFNNSSSALTRAEGIYIVPVQDSGSVVIGANGNRGSAFYDFYIKTCWYGSGADVPSTISTIVRLYDPDVEVVEYSANTFTIQYVENGGTYPRGIPQTESVTTFEKSHAFVLTDQVPTRSGYDFLGYQINDGTYAKNATKIKKPGDTISVSADTTGTTVTIYPVWGKLYTFTAKSESGVTGIVSASSAYNSRWGTNAEGDVATIHLPAGDTATAKGTPRPKYVFSDWYKGSSFEAHDNPYNVVVSSDNIAITAKFSLDVRQIDRIRVLNVYPGAGDNLKSWMDVWGKVEGKPVIITTPVSIDTFNSNPNAYPINDYDIVVFGFWDSNNHKDISSAVVTWLGSWTKAEKPIIFGHDTLAGTSGTGHPNFNQFASYAGLEVTSGISYNVSSTVKITKNSTFTTYPYGIGSVGTQLSIPQAHFLGQRVKDANNIFLNFTGQPSGMDSKYNFYLAASGTGAMIQTGHSSGAATNDEQKILANLIFYLYSQYTNTPSFVRDFAIYYNTNGGTSLEATICPPNLAVTSYATDCQISTVTPSRAGYRFLGWAESASGSVKYQPGSTVSLSQTKSFITLFAKWEDTSYHTVTIARQPLGYGMTSTSTILRVPKGTAVSIVDNLVTIGNNTALAIASPQDNQYRYYFKNWTNSCGATVTKSCTITANFDREPRSFNIAIKTDGSGYGSVNRTSIPNVTYGSAVTIKDNTITVGGVTVTATPIGSSSDHSYIFNGWINSCGSTVATNCTITANFAQTGRTYAVTIAKNNDYGTVSKNIINVPYGAPITINGKTANINNTSITATPYSDTAQYTYYFSDWTNNCGSTVVNDCTIIANFARYDNSYTITIASNNNSYGAVSLSRISATYGSSITTNNNTLTINGTKITAAPIASTTEYSYSFSSWSNDCGTIVSKTCTITANFVREPRYYRITIRSNNTDYGNVSLGTIADATYGNVVSISGNKISIATKYGTKTSIATPTATTVKNSYSFTGWTNNCSNKITANCTITANFTSAIRKYTVTVARNNTSYGAVSTSSFYVDYGTAISISSNVLTVGSSTSTAAPSAQTAQYSYAFSNWTNGCGSTVTGTCTVTANFARAARNYTVTWNGNGGSTPAATVKTYGSQIGALPTPTRSGYTFDGWFTAASGGSKISTTTTVTGNVTYYAHWRTAWVDTTNTINFNSWSDLTNNYSIQIGSCGHSDEYCNRDLSWFYSSSYASGGYLYWKAVQTDVYPRFAKSINTSKNILKSWEIRFIWDGSTEWMEPEIHISSTAGRALYIWPRYYHYSSYKTYYIFYNNYGTNYNKKAIASTGWGSGIIGSGTMASTGSWHTIKFTNTSGTTWSVSLDGTTLGTSDLGGNINYIHVDLLLGWWQTNYPLRIDYIKEEYKSLQ